MNRTNAGMVTPEKIFGRCSSSVVDFGLIFNWRAKPLKMENPNLYISALPSVALWIACCLSMSPYIIQEPPVREQPKRTQQGGYRLWIEEESYLETKTFRGFSKSLQRYDLDL